MKIQPYIDKLQSSKQYKTFQNQYNDAFLVAGFFVLDFESGANMHQIDYYVPSKKKVAAFTLDKEIVVQLLDTVNKKVPEKLDMKTNVDLDALKGILEDEMKNRSITEDIKKIIAVLQTIEGKKIWVLSCVLSGMGILKAHVEDSSRTVLKMEKSNLMDYIKRIPGAAMMQQGQAPAQGKQGINKKVEMPSMPDEDGEESEAPAEDRMDNAKQLKMLADLKMELQKEKVELEQARQAAIESEKRNVKSSKTSSKKSKKR